MDIPTRTPLVPFQARTVEHAVHVGRGRWYIADPVGLGKTAQAIGIAQVYRAREPKARTLVVTKASLTSQWSRQLVKFAGLPATVWNADGVHGSLDAAYHLVGYEGVIRYGRTLMRELAPRTIVYDEAHKLRNPATDVTRACLGQLEAPHVVCTSATPVLNGADEFFPIANYLRPDLFPSRRAYLREFGAWSPDLSRNLSWLHYIARGMMSRHAIEDVAPQMPRVDAHELWVDLEGEERARYRRAEQRILGDRRPSAVDAMQLIRLLEPAKLRVAWSLLAECLAMQRTALLFSTYRAPCEATVARFGRQCVLVDGEVSIAERQRAVDAIERGEAKVGAFTIGAGAEGLNVPSAEVVVHLDPNWLPDLHDQATGRARRLDSTHRVILQYQLLVSDSIDAYLRAVQEERRRITSTVATGRADTGARTTLDTRLWEEVLARMRGDRHVRT